MNKYLKTNSTKLTLDTRTLKSEEPTVLELHIPKKDDPDTWFMSCENVVIDDIEVILTENKPAKILIELHSQQEPLEFANANEGADRQIFDGILFMTGNRTIKNLKAFGSRLIKPYMMLFTVTSSSFWQHSPLGEALEHRGNKIGFRFSIKDKKHDLYFSHDPILIGRDWL